MSKKISLLCGFFCIIILSVYCSDKRDRYDLKFTHLGQLGDISQPDSINSECLQWAITMLPLSKSEFSISKTELIGGKYPTIIDLKRKKADPIEVYIMQEFAIPEKYNKKKSKLSVTLNCKTENMDSLLLSLLILDNRTNPLQCKTFDINSENWESKTHSIQLDNQSAVLLIQLKIYDASPQAGKVSRDKDVSHRVFLDRMAISINGDDLNDAEERETPDKESELKLDRAEIIDLCDPEKNFDPSKLPSFLNEKQIIGLGESVHGASKVNEIAYEIIKDQVKNHNCKHIVFERSMTSGLYLEMFIQGRLPNLTEEETLQRIKNEQISSSQDGIDNLINLLLFLKDYNSKAEKKVHIWGVDPPLTGRGHFNYFADYILSFTNEDNFITLKPLLEIFEHPALYPTTNEELFSMLNEKRPEMEKIMGEENYRVFKYVLEKFSYFFDDDPRLTPNPKDSRERKLYKELNNRDIYKWYRTKGITELFPLSKDNRMLIYMHESHLGKGKNLPDAMYVPKIFGRYLSENFGDQYASVNMLIGKGERKVRTQYGFDREKIEYPPANSIEYAGLKSNIPAFYYSTQALPEKPFYTKNLGFTTESMQFNLLINKDKYDGFIFIDKTTLTDDTKELIDMSYEQIQDIVSFDLGLREKAIEKILGNN